ncbi:hypothetical protein [Cellulomonas sp. P5_C5]
MTESDTTPDPVRETAPTAPPAPEDQTQDDDVALGTGVFPVAGAGTGTVPPPAAPGRGD